MNAPESVDAGHDRDAQREGADGAEGADSAPRIDSRASFTAALHWGFAQGLALPARRIVCADATLADWPLDDANLLSALTTWLRLPQRRLVLLTHSFDDMPRRWPRFNNWRASWSHAIEAWQPPADAHIGIPSILLAGTASVRLIDAQHWRGRASHDARHARKLGEQLDAVLQHCEAGMPVHTLGL